MEIILSTIILIFIIGLDILVFQVRHRKYDTVARIILILITFSAIGLFVEVIG
jgi:hypothetical protein